MSEVCIYLSDKVNYGQANPHPQIASGRTNQRRSSLKGMDAVGLPRPGAARSGGPEDRRDLFLATANRIGTLIQNVEKLRDSINFSFSSITFCHSLLQRLASHKDQRWWWGGRK